MKSIVVISSVSFESMIAEKLCEQHSDISITTIDKNDISDPKAVVDLAFGKHYAIIFPLTLPKYNSLRLAEVVHKNNLSTVLVLNSRTDTPDDILLKLFDMRLDIMLGIRALIEKDVTVSPRIKDPRALDTALHDILKSASCFRTSGSKGYYGDYKGDHYGWRSGTLSDYKESFDEELKGRSPLYFISYARKNLVETDRVELLLRRENRLVWRDAADLRAGEPLVSSIYSGIDEAHTIICVLSEQYCNSNWCIDELTRAIHLLISNKKPRVVGLRIDDYPIPKEISARLWLEAQTPEKMTNSIGAILKQEAD